MAIPHIKATYTLDVGTLRTLEAMARRWDVTKSEALRRAIRSAAESDARDDDRTGLLDQVQRDAALSSKAARSWERDVRAERRAPGAK